MGDTYQIEDIVDVQITLGGRPITQAGFETPLILTAHEAYSDVQRTYSDIDSIVNDGFASGSGVHTIAQDMFSGDNPPSEIIVGKRGLTKYEITPDVFNEEDYTVNIKAGDASNLYTKTFTITSDTNATATEIVDALVTAINGDADIGSTPQIVSATNNADVLEIELDVNGTRLSAGVGTDNLTIAYTASENVDNALSNVVNENNNWYFLTSDSHSDTDVKDLAAYAEANTKMYSTSLANSDIWTSSTTDLLTELKDLQYDQTIVTVDKTADKNFHEGAVVGAMAGLTPGSSTLHGKTLPGVPVSRFTRTQANFITGKNGNIYTNIGGVGFYKEGNVVSGRYFDVIRGANYLEARMEEDIFGLIKRRSDRGLKVPYTQGGITLVEGVMYSRLQSSVNDGFLAASPAPKVLAPLVGNVSDNDKANRILPDVPFEATLAGAIHTVKIRGYVSV